MKFTRRFNDRFPECGRSHRPAYRGLRTEVCFSLSPVAAVLAIGWSGTPAAAGYRWCADDRPVQHMMLGGSGTDAWHR